MAADSASEFRAYIASLGFEPPAQIEAGKWLPFSTNGKRSDSAGRAKLFPDGQGGIVHDWRSGESWAWRREQGRELASSELLAWQEKIERAKREAREEREEGLRETAKSANLIWKILPRARVTNEHPYLIAKGVKAHGLKVYRGVRIIAGMKVDGALAVPSRDGSGQIRSLQFIAEDGSKRYLPGPREPGLYHAIGTPAGTLCIAEGYATGASIHEATGNAVAVAFDARNLEPTAKALRAKFPDVRLIVCADDDAWTEGNPGLAKARTAALAVGALLAVPDFGADRPAKSTDFNDLARARGPAAVRECIERAARVEGPEATQSGESMPSPSALALGAAGERVDSVQIIRADSIAPEPVDWLWNGFLAAGKLHVMAGAPGTGKTTLALAFAATLSCGGRWPDATEAALGDVLIWSGEDSASDTLVPRLLAMGTNLARVHFVGRVTDASGTRPFDPASDFPTLEAEAIRLPGLRLVIVDPIVSAVLGDSHKNAEVRRGLQPLVDFAERSRCAVLGISHFSKGSAGRDVVERVTGSLAFGALARIVLATAKPPEESPESGRLLVRAKSNLGPDGGGFRYELRNVELLAPVAGITASRVEWVGTVEGSARDILAAVEVEADPGERSATDEATEALRDLLLDGRIETREARKRLKANGYSEKQIRNARQRLGVKRERDGYGGTDYWQLPRSCPVPAVPAQTLGLGTNGHEREPEGMNGAGEGAGEIL